MFKTGIVFLKLCSKGAVMNNNFRKSFWVTIGNFDTNFSEELRIEAFSKNDGHVKFHINIEDNTY